MPKNLILFVLLLFISVVFSCRQKPPAKEFEGVITYKTHYTSWKDTDSTKRYNDTLRVYYSHGNVAKVHSGNNVNNIKKELFLVKDHQSYCTLFNVDTLLWMDITKSPNMSLTKMDVVNYDKPILGHLCQSVNVLIERMGKYSNYYSEHQYIFAGDYLPIDKHLLSNYKLGYFDEVMAKSEHYYLAYKYKLYSGSTKQIITTTYYEAISVKEEKVDPSVFMIDKLPLKEIKP